MSTHDKWIENLKKFPANLQLPPPTLSELGIEYTQIIPGELMSAKIPFQKRFTNPLGVYQGGMLAACLDEVFGPLSYLCAKSPCLTLSMNITYLGSFKEEMGHCEIKSIILKKTKNFIFMQADVRAPDGELIAHAQTHVKVL